MGGVWLCGMGGGGEVELDMGWDIERWWCLW